MVHFECSCLHITTCTVKIRNILTIISSSARQLYLSLGSFSVFVFELFPYFPPTSDAGANGLKGILFPLKNKKNPLISILIDVTGDRTSCRRECQDCNIEFSPKVPSLTAPANQELTLTDQDYPGY